MKSRKTLKQLELTNECISQLHHFQPEPRKVST